MKKRTGNHTKTAAITAIALTAAVMAPAMTMRNTRGAQQENPSVGLEENAVWTDEENFRAELTVKIRGLDEVHTDSAQETAEPDQDPGNDVQDEEIVEQENSQDADEDEIQMQSELSEEEPEQADQKTEYFMITYISEYFQPDIDTLSEQTQAEPVAVINQKGESTEIIRLTSIIDTEKMEEGEIAFSFPVLLREEYRTPQEDMMYSVIQEEPLQKDRPGAASYLQMGSGEEAQILAEGESPVLHVRAVQQTPEEPEPTEVLEPTKVPEPDPSQSPDSTESPAPNPTKKPTAVPTETPKATPTPRPSSTPVPSPTVSQAGVNGFGTNFGVTPTPASDPVSYQSSSYGSQTGISYKTASKPATGDQTETGLSIVLLLFAAMSGIGAFARLKGKNER